ncbi:hypothetical protein A3860_00540 [Niastella vici]|uniref:Acyltransferase 3 domain-containing protein n=1 Tax=Niastella vici TaxID=1703345 RepID=A0A1V9G8A4_9BACT|nr:acyltransferase [Niastella vici]OQP66891.1 hypothetical protein A3860_00540 [Niastella vici]
MRKVYTQLDGFRFVFIFLVLLEHWLPYGVFKYTKCGTIGVNLFFVLSGFLLGEILLEQKATPVAKEIIIKNFFIRRSLRIFPLYFVVIILYSVFFTSGQIFLWNATYTTNILECININRVPLEFQHIWSLCVEEQFYLIFPFIIVFVPKEFFLKIFIGAIVIAFAWRFISINSSVFESYPNKWSSRFPLSAFDALFGGALLAYFKVHHYIKTSKFFSLKIVPVLLFSLIAITIFLTVQQEAFWTDLFLRLVCTFIGIITIGYAIIIGYSGHVKRFLEHPAIAFMGKISYGIYLFHPFVQEIYFQYFPIKKLEELCKLVPKLQYNMYLPHFVILFVFTILISVISFFLFEKRFLKLKRYFI